MSTSAPEGVPSWADVLSVFVIPLLGLVAQHRFRTGWGPRGAELRAQHAGWALFLTRFGYVLMPWTWAGLAIAVAMVSFRLVYETGLDVFGLLGMVLALGSIACLAWGIWEYRRPSPWRHRPAWLEELERTRSRS